MSAETRPDGTPPHWGAVGLVVLGVAFAVGFVNFPLQVVGARFEYLPGDDIDNPLNNFVLEHGYRYLTGRADAFWDVPSFYPEPLVTAWSDAHIGMLPVYAALRAVGLPPERAFQGHFLIPFLLNFVAAAWALKRLRFGPFGGAAGAYLFAFGLPLVAQLNHTQLLPRFLVPLAVVFAWETLREPRRWRFGALAACAVGQAYLSVYTAYFLLLLLAAGFVVVAVRFRAEVPWAELFSPGRSEWRRRYAVIAVAVIAMLPLAVGHARGAGSPSRDAVRLLAPRAIAWLSPPAATALHTGLGDATGSLSAVGEGQLLPGLVTLVALASGLVLAFRPGPLGERRAAVVVGAWVAVLLALLVTHFGAVWLYAPIAYVPGSGAIRAIGRVVLVLLFPAGVALAGGVDELVAWVARAWKPVGAMVGVLALALVAADNALSSPDGPRAAEWSQMRYSLDHIRARQQRISDAIRRHPAPTMVYVFPSVAEEKRLGGLVVQLEAMRAAQDLGLPCVNGWSGYVPRHWGYFVGYRALLEWLTVRHSISEQQLAGLVVVGEPEPDADPQYEAAMRARFPVQAPGPVP